MWLQRRAKPLVGACVGPYGGFLADGSEYSGSYGLPPPADVADGAGEGRMNVAELAVFHREQVAVLVASGAELLIFETLPCAMEGLAIASLLQEHFPTATAIISFSCKDEVHLNSGEPLAPALAAIEHCTQIIAVGVNCTPPHLIAPLLTAAATATAKPFVACAYSQNLHRALKLHFTRDVSDGLLACGDRRELWRGVHLGWGDGR